MAIFQCKMCAGNLNFEAGDTICTCDYCGTKQTLPRIDSDQKTMLYNRANRLRINNEFDRAMTLYENILKDDSTDAESYWSLILCRYGIEYVEDPSTKRRKPTIRRTQFTSIFDDDDYKSAINFATDEQKIVYELEAKTIDDIQKKILSISSREEPFDVFICYKDSDENGNNTKDRDIGFKLYNEMTREGLKVFFACITLEDKIGQEYEPYIFAALNSAKVMIAIGTKPEYFNAVWVKNEWSRYQLLLGNNDVKRLLIPVYNDANDLPNELSLLQGQDINKIGYELELVYQIKKFINRDKKQGVKQENVGIDNVRSIDIKSLLKRGTVLLEDEEFEKADELFEDVLNNDPENPDAYIGKLMAKHNAINISKLKLYYLNKYIKATGIKYEGCPAIDSRRLDAISKYYIKDYMSEVLINKVYNSFNRYYDSYVEDRKKQKQLLLDELKNEKLLVRANMYAKGELKKSIETMLAEIEAQLDKRIKDAEKNDKENIERISNDYGKFLDQADKEIKELYENALNRQEEQYQIVVNQMKKSHSKEKLKKSIEALEKMNGYKDTKKLADKCRRKIIGKTVGLVITILAIVISIPIILISILYVKFYVIPHNTYVAAVQLMDNGDYNAAIEEFNKVNYFEDSSEQIEICKKYLVYNSATEKMDEGDYLGAINIFNALIDFSDSEKQIENCKKEAYLEATRLYTEGEVEKAYILYKALGQYEACEDMIIEIRQNYPLVALKNATVGDIVSIGDYKGNTNWIVVEKREEGRIILLSENVVDSHNFANKSDCIFEHSDLIDWLNNSYLPATFNEEEQEYLYTITFTYNNGNNYQTRCFVPSMQEMDKWFANDEERKATLLNDESYINWWLRDTSSIVPMYAAYVDETGKIIDADRGNCHIKSEFGVRPAIFIDLSKLQ